MRVRFSPDNDTIRVYGVPPWDGTCIIQDVRYIPGKTYDVPDSVCKQHKCFQKITAKKKVKKDE